MSKKGKGVVLDAKARLKYQTLMQDYEELQKEVDFMSGNLEASKQRKLMLAAEVRFLQRRYKYLVKTKNTNSVKDQSPVQPPSSLKRAKITKKQILIGKEANQHRLPLVPEPTFKKKQAPLIDAFPVFDLNHKGIMHKRKEVPFPNTTPVFHRNSKERMFGANDAPVRNPTAAFDLNQDTTPSEREASLPNRAPIFDLNEISTGDEDFQFNVEANKFLIRGMNEEQQNDMKLSICRSAGESSSRAGKRKISWQDPVALRV